MKAFSMFSGIGGFELGAKMASEDIEFIGYSEIDKYAIQVYEKHFLGATNYGNATTIDGEQLPDFDLLVGGFPCQAFSVAGKQKGFNETRGTLFFDIARILSVKRPRYLVLANVKGLLSHDKGETFQTILRVLSDLGYGVEWQILNSKDYGVPQNRERIFIIGYLGNRSPRKVFPITGNGREASVITGEDISYALDSSYYKGAVPLHKARRQLVATPVLTPEREKKRQNGRRFKEPDDPSFTLTGQDIHGVMLNEITKAKSQANRIYDSDGLATTLRSEGGGLGAKTGLYKVKNPLKGKTEHGWHFEQNVYETDGISRSLKSTEGSGNKPKIIVKDGTKKGEATVETGDTVNLSYPNSKTRRGRVGKKIAQTLETSMEQYTIVDKPRILDASHRNEGIREYKDYSPTLNSRDYKEPRYVDEGNGLRIRRLTPTECERLQGFPDGWTEGLSDTQRYKTLGNAVTTTVVKAIMERLLWKIN